MIDILATLLKREPIEPIASLGQWEERHRHAIGSTSAALDQALLAGAAMDRLAYAFASGYQIALASLFGGTGGQLAALCATEEDGAHPRDIQTQLREGRLFGKKTFVTLGPAARLLWVVASEGIDAEGQNRLRVVRVRLPKEDLEIRPMKPTTFIPEIPHAELFLEGVDVSAEVILPGDGYQNYLKPFRTAEDLYVHAAILGWYSRLMAIADAPATAQEELLVYVSALRSLGPMPLSAPTMQLGLEGVLTCTRKLLESPGAWWADVDAKTRDRWERDKPLLAIASRARARRRESAWKRLHAG